MRSLRELQEWCRASCTDYPNVHIRDLCGSFRDGLAFCAIIHRHRPELIAFSSLSQSNAYLNNKLAFEVAETKLGIPALLDPSDVVSLEVPDRFGVITYLSQYYDFFSSKNRAVPSKSTSSHMSALDRPARSKTAEDLEPCESSTGAETSSTDGRSEVKQRAVCTLCLRPVHLIQRQVVDGRLYHRSCFRCKVCSVPLLPESYTQGSDPCSLICTHHLTEGKSDHRDATQRSSSTPHTQPQERHVSLDGSIISSFPIYTKDRDSQVFKALETSKTGSPETVRDTSGTGAAAQAPLVGAKDRKEEGSRPIPAPRRMLNCSAAPVPAPRIKTIPTDGSYTVNKSESPSSHSSGAKVKPNHPWMTIVHPGPWTQLPPAPPPVPAPRSKLVSGVPKTCQQAKIPSPNPFDEEEEEEEEDGGNKAEARTRGDKEAPSCPDVGGACSQSSGNSSESSSAVSLPRSVSVPAIMTDRTQTDADVTEEQETVTTFQSKTACNENPFNRKPAMSKSKTLSDLSSSRAPAPGHGFPLVKRKVQTEPRVSTEELQEQLSDLHTRLEAVEQRGVELERRLRECCYDWDKDDMLTEWFSLVHQRRVLSHKSTELVYQIQQQKLEDRQSDVEYELRCLLNKPEGEWSRDDRDQEQQLMDELVVLIDERNQIISSLDRDRQREREQDEQWDGRVKSKIFQKLEVKKPKGKFKPTKVLKLLNHKAKATKEKKS